MSTARPCFPDRRFFGTAGERYGKNTTREVRTCSEGDRCPKKRIPGCRLHPGLQRGVETFSQCPPCGSVYRRQSQCGSPGSLQKVSGCEGIGGSRCGRDRGDRPPLRPWKKQGPGHQRLHEHRAAALEIEIFHSEDQFSAHRTYGKPGQEKRPGIPEMRKSGRAWRKSPSHITQKHSPSVRAVICRKTGTSSEMPAPVVKTL